MSAKPVVDCTYILVSNKLDEKHGDLTWRGRAKTTITGLTVSTMERWWPLEEVDAQVLRPGSTVTSLMNRVKKTDENQKTHRKSKNR